jgi:hypothetical protein
MIDITKPSFKASELLESIELLHDVPHNYILLNDYSMGGTFLKMMEVINVLDEYGWEIVSVSHTGDGMTMYVLARRITKAKNQL